MTDRELIQLLLVGDAEAILAAAAELDEDRRLEIDARFRALFRAVYRAETEVADSEDLRLIRHWKVEGASSHVLESIWERIRFCFAGPRQLSWMDQRDPEAIDRIVRAFCDRQPPWLQAYVAEETRGTPYFSFPWPAQLGLIEGGLLEHEWSDERVGYYAAVEAIDADHLDLEGSVRRTIARIERDPALLEGFWRFFEIDVPAVHGELWSAAIAGMLDAGLIQRKRLLDALLAALALPITFPTLSAHRKALLELKPRDDELAGRQSEIELFFGVRDKGTRKLGLDLCVRLAGVDLLDVDTFLESIPQVLLSQTLSHVKKALALVADLLEHDPSAVAEALCLGLEHPNVAIQKEALRLLDQAAVSHRDVVVERLCGSAPDVDATLRARLEALTGKTREIHRAAAPFDPQRALERAEQIDVRALDAVGWATQLEASRRGHMARLTALDSRTVPSLGSLPPLVPVASVEELIDLSDALLREVENADDIDRWLEGVARLSGESCPRFQTRLQPVLRLMERNWSYGALLSSSHGDRLRSILDAWLEGSRPEIRVREICPCGFCRDGVADLLWDRFRRLGQQIVDGQATTPIWVASHQGGWLAPECLVERLVEAGDDVEDDDLILALLRLAPDRRELAARALRTSTGSWWWRTPVLWALGDESAADPSTELSAYLLHALASARPGGPSPIHARPWSSIELEIEGTRPAYPAGSLVITVIDELWPIVGSWYSSFARHGLEAYWGRGSEQWLDNRGAGLGVVATLDWHDGIELPEAGLKLLIQGITDGQRSSREEMEDRLGTCFERGQVAPVAFAELFAEACAAKRSAAGRGIEALAAIADRSPLCELAVVECFEAVVIALGDRRFSKLEAVLEQLVARNRELGRHPNQVVLEALAGRRGKIAAIVSTLAALEGAPTPRLHQALEASLDAVLDRAERARLD